VETILDPRRLAPLVKSASEVALRNPRIRSALARGESLVRSVRANKAFRAGVAVAGAIAARLKASPPLSGTVASVAAILVFVFASPLIFRTLPPPAKAAPAPAPAETPAEPAASAPAPSTPAPGPASPSGAASGEAGHKSASTAAPSAAPSRPHAAHRNPEPFIERFATLDERRWYVADRGPNGAWTANDFRRSQISLTGEGLNVTLAKTTTGKAPPYTSGEISTLSMFRYGYFEGRLRVARGAGLDTGLFTYVREKGPTGWNEIDIEFLGRNTRQVELTAHVGKQVATRTVQLGFDAAEGFHTYGFDWRPDSIAWYVDGRKVYEVSGPIAASLNRPQNLLFDLWGSETLPLWTGNLDPKAGPRIATLSCFAYAHAYEGRPLCSEEAGEREPRGPSRIVLK
jgi:hypothetical protein